MYRLANWWDWFYSYFDFTKVWSRRVISAAVSNAVAASQAGYAVGLVSSDGNITVREPRLIRIAETLPSEEIDMSSDAGLLEVSYAQHLLDTARAPAAATPPNWNADDSGAEGEEPTVRDGQTDRSEQPPAKPVDTGSSPDIVTRVKLTATVGKSGFFDLNRALSWLRDNADEIDVDVSIRASAPAQGFDRVKLRNGFIEPLEEGAPEVKLTLE